MSSYGFIKELIEKEHTPTPAYVFDLDKMKEFVKKVIKTIAGDTGVYFIKMHIWDKLKKE